jgi:hypothetical protein
MLVLNHQYVDKAVHTSLRAKPKSNNFLCRHASRPVQRYDPFESRCRCEEMYPRDFARATTASFPRAIRASRASTRREIYRHQANRCINSSSDCTRHLTASRTNCDLHDLWISVKAEAIGKMLRTAILRSAAVAARTAVRPIPSIAARRIAVAPVSRVSSFVPKTVAWQAVRCYASGSSLDKTEVYERIKQLLSGFDKVGLAF